MGLDDSPDRIRLVDRVKRHWKLKIATAIALALAMFALIAEGSSQRCHISRPPSIFVIDPNVQSNQSAFSRETSFAAENGLIDVETGRVLFAFEVSNIPFIYAIPNPIPAPPPPPDPAGIAMVDGRVQAVRRTISNFGPLTKPRISNRRESMFRIGLESWTEWCDPVPNGASHGVDPISITRRTRFVFPAWPLFIPIAICGWKIWRVYSRQQFRGFEVAVVTLPIKS